MIKKYIDASNLKCPLPLLKTKLALSNLESGDILQVISTDPTSWDDFGSYARISGNKLIEADNKLDSFVYTIKKK